MKVCFQCQNEIKNDGYLINEINLCDDCFDKIITGQEQLRDTEPLPDTQHSP